MLIEEKSVGEWKTIAQNIIDGHDMPQDQQESNKHVAFIIIALTAKCENLSTENSRLNKKLEKAKSFRSKYKALVEQIGKFEKLIAALEQEVAVHKEIGEKRLKIIKRTAGPDTPPRNTFGSKSRSRQKDKSKNGKSQDEEPQEEPKEDKRSSNPHKGTTDNRRADTTNHAQFVPCECGYTWFEVTETRTTTMDVVEKVSYRTVKYREMKGKYNNCGAEAEAVVYEEGNENTMSEDTAAVPGGKMPIESAPTEDTAAVPGGKMPIESAPTEDTAAVPGGKMPIESAQPNNEFTNTVITKSGLIVEREGGNGGRVSDSEIRK